MLGQILLASLSLCSSLSLAFSFYLLIFGLDGDGDIGGSNVDLMAKCLAIFYELLSHFVHLTLSSFFFICDFLI